ELEGLQAAVGLNVVRGAAAAGQFAVGGNVAGGALSGGQFSVGANIAGAGGVGGQFTVGANIAGGALKGVQASVGANVAPSMVGLQAATGLNFAKEMRGAQLSLLNVGGDVSGAQVGLVNIASKVEGLQLGLLNVARESQGEALGLLSFIGNGQANVQLWASDVAYTNVALKFGSQHFHTLLTLGFNPGTNTHRRRYVAGFGFGTHIPTGRLFFDLEAIGSSVHTDNLFRDGDGLNVLAQLRLVAGWQVAKRFALIGGVTGNTLVTWDNGDRWEELGIGPEWRSVSDGGNTTVRVWPGVLLGVQL
ncbi:LA_2272 family surface repeat-containing protein, partial [Corallococcus terminator]